MVDEKKDMTNEESQVEVKIVATDGPFTKIGRCLDRNIKKIGICVVAGVTIAGLVVLGSMSKASDEVETSDDGFTNVDSDTDNVD